MTPGPHEASPAGEGRRSGLSLRRRILITGAAITILVASLMAGLVLLSLSARNQLSAVTEDYIEEQRIADRITHAVMRQLAATSALRARIAGGGDQVRRDFQQAGDEVNREIRRYLFRDLSPEERLQLEEMGEDHRRMEVAASTAMDFFRRELIPEGESAREVMFEHLLAFLESTDSFLRMRENQLSQLRARQHATFRLLYVGGGLLLVALMGGGLVMARTLHHRIALPLEELAGATEQLGAGDLSVRLPPGRDPELQALSAAFNRMAESLERTTERLEGQNTELSGTLETLRRTQAELIRAEKLSAMGRMTAGLAHELNNPLASVVGYAQLLEDELEGREQVDAAALADELLGPLLREAERAQHLVRSFLQFSRTPRMDLEAVSLEDALQVVANLRHAAFRQAGFRLELRQIPDCRVRGEEQMLQGIFLNLVNNALDALETLPSQERLGPGGQTTRGLTVLGQREGDRVVLRFEDDGPGLSEPDRVFEPFYTTKPVGEGTGLGLALAHRFALSFGGDLRAENRLEGGARLTLELQVAPSESTFAAEPELAPVLPGGPVLGENAPRVLVVEDEEPLRALHLRLLHRLEVSVLTAATVRDARTLLETERVDVILCDVKMPGESGFQFYQWLEANEPDRLRRFLFVTGDVSAPDLVELSKARPDLFLHKPFNISEYLSRVAALLTEGAPTAG